MSALPPGANHVSYESAMDLLCSMFSDWDRETLAVVLESNGYHVENTSTISFFLPFLPLYVMPATLFIS